MRLTNRIAISTLTDALKTIAGFIGTLYLANVLGPGPIGAFALGMTVIKWLEISDLGLGPAIRKRISENQEINSFFTAGLSLRISITGILLVGLYLLQNRLNEYLGGEYGLIVVLIFVLASAHSFMNQVVGGLQLIHVARGFDAIERVARSVLQVGFAVIGLGTLALFYGYLASMAFVIGLYALMLAYAGMNFALPERRHFKNILKFAKFSWLQRIRGRFFSWLDVLILGFFVTQNQIGIYQVSWTLAATLWLASRSISSNLFPEISYLSIEEQTSRVRRIFEEGILYSGILPIPGLAGIALFGDRLLGIYGSEFVQGHATLVALGILAVAASYEGQIQGLLDGLDRPDLTFRINLLFLAANIGLNLILIPTYGIWGAGVATAVATTASLVYGWILVRRTIRVTVPAAEIGKQVSAAIVMGAILRWLLGMYSPRGLLEVLTTTVMCAVIYFTILLVVSAPVREKSESVIEDISSQF